MIIDHFGPNANSGCKSRTGVFALAIDTEQVRSLATDTQHKALLADIHAIVLVSNAARQGCNGDLGLIPLRHEGENALELLAHAPSVQLSTKHNTRFEAESSLHCLPYKILIQRENRLSLWRRLILLSRHVARKSLMMTRLLHCRKIKNG